MFPVMNNLMIAPNIQWQGDGSGAIYVMESTLSGFSTISNNVWPQMPASSQQPGDCYLYPSWGNVPNGFVKNSDWNNLPQVNNDQFANVTVGNDVICDITLNGTTAGALGRPSSTRRHGAGPPAAA